MERGRITRRNAIHIPDWVFESGNEDRFMQIKIYSCLLDIIESGEKVNFFNLVARLVMYSQPNCDECIPCIQEVTRIYYQFCENLN